MLPDWLCQKKLFAAGINAVAEKVNAIWIFRRVLF
jgi:hypothetical protein